MIAGKDHELYDKYAELIEKNMEYLEEAVNSEGVWDITWEMGTVRRRILCSQTAVERDTLCGELENFEGV